MRKQARNKQVAAAVLALSMAGPAAMVPQMAQAYVFSNIRVEGNQRIEPGTILSYAKLPRGKNIPAGEVNDAQQRLQNSGLFETVELSPQGGTLVIRVSEYPTINVINFEGNTKIKDDKLAQMIQSKARRVFSPATAEADAQMIAQAYAMDGRLAARVDPKIIRRAGNRVDLVFEIREGKVTEIERISFTGNRAFSDRRLRQVLETKQAGLLRAIIKRDTFNPDRIPLDEKLLTDFYRSRGYADMKVQGVAPEVARERDAFFITFAIQEGPRYTFGNISTVSEIAGVDASAFQAQNRVRRGEVYNPAVIENTIRRMETVAIAQGLNFVNIEPRVTRNPRNGTLDLVFALTRGPKIFVERIDIQGNTTTLDEVIRRQFNTVEGDPFNPREIRNAAERIRALGYFADAEVNSREGSSPQQVIVDVNVEEQPTGSLQFGVSYGATSGVGLNVGLSEKNFLGRGQALSLSVSTGKDNRNFGFSFAEPSLLSRDLRGRISAWYNTTDQQNAKYNTRSLGLSTGLEFPVSQNGRLELNYTAKRQDILDVTKDSSPILQAEEGRAVTSALGYSYSYDSRRLGLDPLNAWVVRFSQDYAGLGGDVKSVTSNLFFGVQSNQWSDDITLRAELQGGMIHMLGDQSSRAIDRFGNGEKVRGFKPSGIGPRDLYAVNRDALGGNMYWAGRIEAEFPIGLPEEYGIKGGLFADAGSVWGLNTTAGTPGPEQPGGLVDDKMYVRSSVGASIFWTTPLGPLRMNWAKALRKQDYDETQVFDLTVSTKF